MHSRDPFLFSDVQDVSVKVMDASHDDDDDADDHALLQPQGHSNSSSHLMTPASPAPSYTSNFDEWQDAPNYSPPRRSHFLQSPASRSLGSRWPRPSIFAFVMAAVTLVIIFSGSPPPPPPPPLPQASSALAQGDDDAYSPPSATQMQWWTNRIDYWKSKADDLADRWRTAEPVCDCTALPDADEDVEPPIPSEEDDEALLLLAAESAPSFPLTMQELPPSCAARNPIAEEYGGTMVKRSVRHAGSMSRLRQQLAKIRNGQALKIGVLGGSVSTGHGAALAPDGTWAPALYGAIPPNQIWHTFVHSALNALLRAADKTTSTMSHTIVNGAKPAVGTDYHNWCWSRQIPINADIILLENAINDEFHMDYTRSFESLIRQLLSLPSHPAIIVVETWMIYSKAGAASGMKGGDAHLPVAAYYDLPVISLRDALLPHYLEHPTLKQPFFNVDPVHIGKTLHRALGDLVNHFIYSSLCHLDVGLDQISPKSDNEVKKRQTESVTGFWPTDGELEQIPREPLSWIDPKLYLQELVIPKCLEAGVDLKPVQNTGWTLMHWKQEKHYWTTDKPNQTITFKINSASTSRKTPQGQIAISYLKSRKYGIGQAKCWIDDQVSRAVTVVGRWDKSTSVGQTEIIGMGLVGGQHTVTCTSVASRDGNNSFRIISVMAR